MSELSSINREDFPDWLYPSGMFREYIKSGDEEIYYSKFEHDIPETPEITNINEFKTVVKYSDYFIYDNGYAIYPISVFCYFFLNKEEVLDFCEDENRDLYRFLTSDSVEQYREITSNSVENPKDKMEIKYGGCFKVVDNELWITINDSKACITEEDVTNNEDEFIIGSTQFYLNFLLQHFEFITQNFDIIERYRMKGSQMNENDLEVNMSSFLSGFVLIPGFCEINHSGLLLHFEDLYIPGYLVVFTLDKILTFAELKYRKTIRTDIVQKAINLIPCILEENGRITEDNLSEHRKDYNDIRNFIRNIEEKSDDIFEKK